MTARQLTPEDHVLQMNAEAFLNARLMADQAIKMRDEAKARFVANAKAMGRNDYEIEGFTLHWADKERRTVDAEALSNVVTHREFDMVTVPKVKFDLLDAALENGLIDAEAVESATKRTAYTEVRVS